jgi:uncharacterized protein YndB with AHSA1/START domain
MSEQSSSGSVDPNKVRKTILVNASQETAWRVFTSQIGAWWPLAHYTIGSAKAVDAIMEPHVGGRWYERGEDGSTCQWGSVLTWEPHARLVLSWDITAQWHYDPELKTEIEVRFIVESKERTRVELEHRHLDRFGEHREQMRRIFDTEGDWGRVLEGFAQVAAKEAKHG